ncbi:MAG TPA: TldD/PmbA family protein [Candidatus Nitrosotalea sp.]|nr:TldD/PmbA family protein [Candidatus Nitrosotalea sp.]
MILQDFADRLVQFVLEKGAQYCDIRAENIESNGFLLENGQIEHITSKVDNGLGVRMLVDGAWGFYSVSNPDSFDELKNGAIDAVKSASYYAQIKKHKVKLAQTQAYVDTVNHSSTKTPTTDEMIKLALDCDKTIRKRKRIHKSAIHMHHDEFQKYFVNSEGTRICQNYDDTIINMTVTANESGLSETVNTTEGGRGDLQSTVNESKILERSEFISEKADKLIDAKPAKEDNAVVVMNPDFVALLSHEILGHPSEADRVLGKEMAWAGGSWWAGKLGTKIGSSELDVIDDPTIPYSLGWYKYDDEGVLASRKSLVKEGMLVGHMQSRETASLFDTVPNSAMRATGHSFMPLIRMACTCIGPGNWDPGEMIKEVKSGYLICDMKVPSIDMMRYNWSISCQYAQKIENGELTELLRDVIVMGNAPDFFNSIDARGNDFTIRPITNCGKGDPMQIMRMGNGGPHIRGIATVKSVGN